MSVHVNLLSYFGKKNSAQKYSCMINLQNKDKPSQPNSYYVWHLKKRLYGHSLTFEINPHSIWMHGLVFTFFLMLQYFLVLSQKLVWLRLANFYYLPLFHTFDGTKAEKRTLFQTTKYLFESETTKEQNAFRKSDSCFFLPMVVFYCHH